ncbi:TolC family protein [Chitinophaga alhagiae]|uniref:TolC family protein n=2 Tax=Chitinophaga alhagiae TaxID=2203219 RepID=A0ABM6WCH4_9BACT|nr:TolC family protein [Chitinophaga alhagiae]
MMFCLKFVWPRATPNNNLPFIKKARKVLFQLIYFCQDMKVKSVVFASISVMLLFANPRPVAAQDSWSYQRCLDYALAHNLTLKQSELQQRLAALTLKQNRLSQLPTINAGLNGGYRFGRSIDPTQNTFVTQSLFNSGFSIDASADIFGWFTKQNAIRASKYQLYAQNFQLEKARNDMGVNIANAFLQILLASEQVKIGKSQVALSQAQLDNTKKLVAAGSVPESNQADMEAQLARDSSTLIAAQNSAITTVLQMKALLNLEFTVPFSTELPEDVLKAPLLNLFETSPEMVFSAAIANQPQYKADEMLVKAADRSLASTRGALYPSLRFYAGAGTNYANTTREAYGSPRPKIDTIGLVDVGGTIYNVVQPGFERPGTRLTPFGDQLSNNFGQNFGLSLNIPILNGWRQRSEVERAKIEVENRKLTMDVNRLQLRQDVYTAHADAIGALQKYNAAITTEMASQKAYDFATKRFEVGLMNSVEYITTQTNLFKAQIDRVSALYDYIFKVKLLEFYRDQKISL